MHPQGEGGANRDLNLARLTLELGVRSERMYLAWLEDAVERVRLLPEEGNQ